MFGLLSRSLITFTTKTALKWFAAQTEDSCAFCRVTQLALLRHLTNAKIMGRFVQSQQQAWSAYDRLLADPRVIFIIEPSALEGEFRAQTNTDSPSHQRWTDAYLAAFARMSGSRLSTFDQGFGRFPGLDFELIG